MLDNEPTAPQGAPESVSSAASEPAGAGEGLAVLVQADDGRIPAAGAAPATP